MIMFYMLQVFKMSVTNVCTNYFCSLLAGGVSVHCGAEGDAVLRASCAWPVPKCQLCPPVPFQPLLSRAASWGCLCQGCTPGLCRPPCSCGKGTRPSWVALPVVPPWHHRGSPCWEGEADGSESVALAVLP